VANTVLQAGGLEEVVDLLGQRRSLSHTDIELLIRELEISQESVLSYFEGGPENGLMRSVAKNKMLECMLCEWPAGADNFFATKNRNFEVMRILSGRLTLIEKHEIKGKMEPYCTTELSSGSIISLPQNLCYSLRNEQKEAARTLHFMSLPQIK